MYSPASGASVSYTHLDVYKRQYELFLDYPENTGGKECFLEITYDGESAYMEKGGEICADHFYTGQPLSLIHI